MASIQDKIEAANDKLKIMRCNNAAHKNKIDEEVMSMYFFSQEGDKIGFGVASTCCCSAFEVRLRKAFNEGFI